MREGGGTNERRPTKPPTTHYAEAREGKDYKTFAPHKNNNKTTWMEKKEQTTTHTHTDRHNVQKQISILKNDNAKTYNNNNNNNNNNKQDVA